MSTSFEAGKPTLRHCDAAIVGAGVAGLAAAIHLRRAGLQVVCLEPQPFPHDRVGESLDWSAPSLLTALGLPGETLIGARVATWKRNIKVVSPGQAVAVSQPPDWWSAPPLGFESVTFHVDRLEMDDRLFALAVDCGVELVWDRAQEVVTEGERVVAVETVKGSRIEASWFIDASGRSARLFARKLGIPRIDYGREKVSLWCYLDTPCENEGTTFYIHEPEGDYLSWIWEIPINPGRASIGCVMAAEHVREQRRRGLSTAEILCERLAPFPRFEPLLAERSRLEVRTTAYRCFVHANTCGPNWLLAGEAAALHDALTGNGVTAALRHAAEGTELILEARERGSLARRQRRVYNAKLLGLGHMFNHAIETAVYEWPIRRGLGSNTAQLVYIVCAFVLNALYTRARPRKWPMMLVFDAMMRSAWIWIETWALIGRLIAALRGFRGGSPRRRAEAV